MFDYSLYPVASNSLRTPSSVWIFFICVSSSFSPPATRIFSSSIARIFFNSPRIFLHRSKHHKATTINGKTGEDPNGWHLTFCYKDDEQLKNKTHTACHGYTKDEFSWELLQSTHAGDKPDSVKRRYSKSASVWPDPGELDEAPEIGYGHFL